MGSVSATVVATRINRGSYDDASGAKYLGVEITFHNGSTAVPGGTDTLDVAVNTVVGNELRTGKTYLLRSYAIRQLANASGTFYAATIGVSGNTIQLTPKTEADWSTNATIAANGIVNGTGASCGYTVFCLVEET